MNKTHSESDPGLDLMVETLLRSAENDGPPPGSLGKTAALLGVSVAPLVTSSGAAAAGLGTSALKVAAGSGVTASTVSVAGATQAGFLGLGLGLGKVATVGALVACGMGVTLSQIWEGAEQSVANGSAANGALSPTSGEAKVRSLPPQLESAKDAEPELSPQEDLPASAEPRAATPVVSSPQNSLKGASTSPPFAGGRTSLDQELKLLSAARSLLQRGDGAGCLQAIDEHRRDFPSGTLSVEASVLKVEALLIASGKEAAAREAETFRKRMPHSMHLKKFVALGLLEEDVKAFDADPTNQ